MATTKNQDMLALIQFAELVERSDNADLRVVEEALACEKDYLNNVLEQEGEWVLVDYIRVLDWFKHNGIMEKLKNIRSLIDGMTAIGATGATVETVETVETVKGG